jgi:hypothetical protein
MEYAIAGYALIWSSLSWFAWRTSRRLSEAERRLVSEEKQ